MFEVMTVFRKIAVSVLRKRIFCSNYTVALGIVVNPNFLLQTLPRDSSTAPAAPHLSSSRENLGCQSPGPLKC
jgi:hypothetical protein